MIRMPKEFLFTLLEKNPLADEFRKFHIRLNTCEKGFACSCPFHSETGKSCVIYPETHNFYCSGCGKGGDVITFLMLMQNLSYSEAIQILAHRSNLIIPEQSPEEAYQIRQRRERCYEINHETANFYYLNLLKSSDKRGLAYFRERQLSPQIIQKYGLGYAPDDWNQLKNYLNQKGYSDEELILTNVCRRNAKGNVYDNFRNRVIFPITDMQRHVIGFGGRVLDDSKPKYLNTSDTPVFDKGRNLFSLYFAARNTPDFLILAEGYMDVIALHQAGFENAVATLGTAITPQQARLIAQYTDQVIISYDNDAAGQNATQKAIQYFQEVGLSASILHIDDDAKDPDEYIKKFGADRFRLLLRNTESVLDFQLNRCRNGLELQTENEKISYLRRCVPVLAKISNQAAQEVYIKKTADELGIRTDILQRQISQYSNKLKNNKIKTDFHIIENQIRIRDEVNPQAQTHRQKSESEKLILCWLMHFPEQFRNLSEQLRPEDFITEFHRKIYDLLCRILPECTGFIPALLGSELSVPEMCRVTEIFICYRDKLNEQAVSQCIQNLYVKKFQPSDQSNLSDNDLLQIIADKKKTTRLHY